MLDCQASVAAGLIDALAHDAGGDSADDGHDGRPGLSVPGGRKEAQRTLMRGFTSVRDGRAAFALKRAIDEGLVDGPRIYPSGAMISQTSGHGISGCAAICRAPTTRR